MMYCCGQAASQVIYSLIYLFESFESSSFLDPKYDWHFFLFVRIDYHPPKLSTHSVEDLSLSQTSLWYTKKKHMDLYFLVKTTYLTAEFYYLHCSIQPTINHVFMKLVIFSFRWRRRAFNSYLWLKLFERWFLHLIGQTRTWRQQNAERKTS